VKSSSIPTYPYPRNSQNAFFHTFLTPFSPVPYATNLLDALVNYAASDFEPHFELPM